jgi:hypothetical protein
MMTLAPDAGTAHHAAVAPPSAAHRLFAANSRQLLAPLVVVRRLESEFAFVDADSAEGSRQVLAIVGRLEARVRHRVHSIYRERLEHLRSVSERSVCVHFGDDPGSSTEYLCTTVIPGEPLVFNYESVAHEQAVQSLLHRCARVLGYHIGSALAGELLPFR